MHAQKPSHKATPTGPATNWFLKSLQQLQTPHSPNYYLHAGKPDWLRNNNLPCCADESLRVADFYDLCLSPCENSIQTLHSGCLPQLKQLGTMMFVNLFAVPHDTLALDIRCHVGARVPVRPQRLEHIAAVILVVGAQDWLDGLGGL